MILLGLLLKWRWRYVGVGALCLRKEVRTVLFLTVPVVYLYHYRIQSSRCTNHYKGLMVLRIIKNYQRLTAQDIEGQTPTIRTT